MKLLAILCLAATAAFSTIPTPGSEDGAVAPANRWTVRGGAAARTGATASRAPLVTPEVAWEYRVRGTIEGEPLVWDDFVVLTVLEGPGRRAVHVVDLAEGHRRIQQPLPPTTPLAPTLWGHRLAIRPAPNRVELYRVAGRRLLPLRTIKAAAPVSEPLLFGEELYLREGPELRRYDLDRRASSWRARPPGVFRGSPSLRGDRVYAAWYDGRGVAHLASVDRSDGTIVGDALIGSHGRDVPGPEDAVDVVVLDRDVFVRLPLPIDNPAGVPFFLTRAQRVGGAFDEAATLHAFPLDPVAFAGGWVAFEERTPAKWIAARVKGTTIEGLVLADESIHSALLDAPKPPSTAGEILYLQGLAVESEDYTIRWRAPRMPRGRAVPIEDGLLVVSAPGTLTALRAPPRIVSRGEARAAEAVVEMDAKITTGYAGLVPKALRAYDLERAERYLATALDGGATSRTLDLAQESLVRLLDEDPRPEPIPSLARALEEEEQALVAKQRSALLQRAREADDDAFRRRVLRVLLERDPDSAAVAQAVQALVPPEAPRAPDFAPESWLDFLDARAGAPTRIVLPPGDRPGRDAEEETLAREAKEWRSDVAGWASESLLVVTPPGRAGAVGSALQTGELVATILEELFSIGEADRERPRLRVFLYETKDEYLRQSQRVASRPEVERGWTAGHYDPTDGISRMFVPEGDEEYRRLLSVHAHELTHHWLDARSPFAGTMGAADQPGYWIAEGIAVWIEEFLLDPAAGTWDAHNPRASSLDLVANAKPADLIPWERMFALTRDDLADLSAVRDRPIPRTWQLGARYERSEIAIFYAQAGALCHYLYGADGGRLRPALLEYVRAWYVQETDALDSQGAFGLSERELGERIVAFARETGAGG